MIRPPIFQAGIPIAYCAADVVINPSAPFFSFTFNQSFPAMPMTCTYFRCRTLPTTALVASGFAYTAESCVKRKRRGGLTGFTLDALAAPPAGASVADTVGGVAGAGGTSLGSS